MKLSRESPVDPPFGNGHNARSIMPLQAGTRLGAYEVLSPIGAGGMGEVYRARDTRLNRDVAIKVLPAERLADEHRRRRFHQEARALSSLNHPHIVTIYEIESAGDVEFMAMEFVRGSTLDQLIPSRGLRLAELLRIAVPVAEALAAAHARGIIHCDVKPANLMVGDDGVVKVLDFGVAKLLEPDREPGAATATDLPAGDVSAFGRIAGTPVYMAPEQASGGKADARSDVFSFGAVLYEIATGARAFEGNSSAETLAAVLAGQPKPPTQIAAVPRELERVILRCLRKEPDRRYQAMLDVRNDLQELEQEIASRSSGMPARPQRRWFRAWVPWALAAASTALAATALLVSWPRPMGMQMQLSLDVRPAESLRGTPGSARYTAAGPRTAFVWTPDGKALVFAGWKDGEQRLYVRPLNRDQARLLPGTEGAFLPVVSADGRSVAFWAAGAIRRVPIAGGPVEVLETGADLAHPPTRIVWAADGHIFYSIPYRPIRQLGPEGASNVTRLGDGEVHHALPALLPGDGVLLYTVRKRRFSWGDEVIVAHVRATGATRVLLHDATDARYAPSGHLVFLRRGQLFAVGFDPVRMEVHGSPVAVLDNVAHALSASASEDVTAAGQFAVATTGTLAWVSGPPTPYPMRTLVAMTRHGQLVPLSAPRRGYGPPVRIAPRGQRLALTILSFADVSVWLYDLVRGTLTKATSDSETMFAAWAPGGERLVFDWLKGGHRSIASLRADGGATPEALVASHSFPSTWLPDGRRFSVIESGQIRIATIAQPKKAVLGPPVQTATPATGAEFSPNGRWLAYHATDSGQAQVYVQPYPGPGPRIQVSPDGGVNPAWNPNGKELFYLVEPVGGPYWGKTRMMVVDVRETPSFALGLPQQLFAFQDWKDGIFACGPTRCYDVAPDGQRFVATQGQEDPQAPLVTHISVITNWLDELKQKVPTGLP